MTRTSDEQATFDRFTKKYQHVQSNLMREIERSVCGCDYGATSWTTLDEAREVGEMLSLKPGKRLLDVGSGSGWPGVYLAKETGCDIVMTDLPLTGLRIAIDRASTERVGGACLAIVADGVALPFSRGWFDAITHSDLLCCLPGKRMFWSRAGTPFALTAKWYSRSFLYAPDLRWPIMNGLRPVGRLSSRRKFRIRRCSAKPGGK